MLNLISDTIDKRDVVVGEADIHVRVLIDVRYTGNGVEGHDIAEMVNRLIERAIGNGALTGDSPAEVEEHSVTVNLISPEADAVDEKVVGDWLQARVDSGNLNPEEMIDMMARYALADPYALRNEFAERMEQDDSGSGLDDLMLTPAVIGRVWSDDRNVEATFNAGHWFRTATDAEIMALAAIGWRGDAESDDVALRVGVVEPDVRKVLAYVEAMPRHLEVGFECEVDEKSALAWLAAHRIGLWARVLCASNDVRLLRAEEPEVLGRWDWLDGSGNACDCSFETIEQAALDAVSKLELELEHRERGEAARNGT